MSPATVTTLVWLAISALGGAVRYGHNHVAVSRDSDLVAANFPDVDIKLSSPAFESPETVPSGFAEGLAGPTDDVTLDQFIQSIARRNEWMNYHLAEFTSEEGRAFPYLYLSSFPEAPSQPASPPKLKVWLQGGVHGNEPAGDQTLLALIGKLDGNQTWALSLLEKMDIMIWPRYNPDGVAYFQRALATNLDPNRDHTKLNSQQSREIKKLFSSFSPHIAVDMHEFTPRNFGKYRHGMDALVAAGKNLNTHPSIRNISEELFASNVGRALGENGFRWEPYFTGSFNNATGEIELTEAESDAKSGRNNYAMSQCITILCEVRGIGLADQHFQRRVATALTMVSSILQTAHDHASYVHETIGIAIQDFIKSEEDIVISDYSETVDRTVTFIDTTNGEVVQAPARWKSTSPTFANLTKSRPEAYIIPRAWSDLATRLQDSGVEVQTLDNGYNGPVEALMIKSASIADYYYEGGIKVTVETESFEKNISLPKGSFLISTQQKNVALAFATLEPEGIDSYLPPKAAYLTLPNPSSRNALSLSVLHDLRSQLHRYNTSPADGKLYILPPFNPNILSDLEAASQPRSYPQSQSAPTPDSSAVSKYGWLLNTTHWDHHRQTLPSVLVLRSSSGPVFSSGHDLRELSRLSHAEIKETFALCAEVMTLIRRSPAPVIGVVHGLATAAGAQLALTTDLPIAYAGTRFQLPGQRIGVPCTSPATAVSRRVGGALAYRMSALAEGVRADELPGNPVEVFPDGDEEALEGRVGEMVSRLSSETSAMAQALGKWAFWTQLEAHRWRENNDLHEREEADGYEKALRWAGRMMALHARTEDGREGMAGFVGKRAPLWAT
ncbi:Carboxypeptidase 2-like protein 3 [Seiridium cupressi]